MCTAVYLFIGFVLGILVSASAVSAFFVFHIWHTLQSINETLEEIEIE